MERLNAKLNEAYTKETTNEVTNPLQVAIEMMALDEKDLKKFMKVLTVY